MHVSMRINAAIEVLLTSEDPHETDTAAREIIVFGDPLPEKSVDWEYKSAPLFRWPKWFQGNAAGVGDVNLTEDQKKDEVVRYGTKKERIGHYRVWKLEPGVIKFHHFWKSSLTTESNNEERPDEYYLFYDPPTQAPSGLGKEFVKKTYSWKFLGRRFVFRKLGIEMIFGRATPSYEDHAVYPK